MPGFKILALLLVALIATTSCSTFRPLPDVNEDSIVENVRVGDYIKITTRAGEIQELTVTKISRNSIAGTTTGGEIEIAHEQIKMIEKKEISWRHTVWQFLKVYFGLSILAFMLMGNS